MSEGAVVSPGAAEDVAGEPRRLPARVLVSSFGRLFLLQALWNYERMQGIGFCHAIAPPVRALSPDDATAARALVPHAGFFNTHPVMASVAVGVVTDQLEKRARGEQALDDAGLLRIKQALGSSLAAMGDPLFWDAVRPLVALSAVYAWRDDRAAVGTIVFLAGYNLIAIGYRIRGFTEGYRRGLAYVAHLGTRLARLTSVIRLFGVVLAALVVSTVLVPPGGAVPRQVLAGAIGLALGGIAFGAARLGPAEWGLGLVLAVLAWVTVGPGF